MKMRPFINSIRSVIGIFLPWGAFACLAAAMLLDPVRDTLGVASAAFAVTLALAAVTFSYARTLKEGSVICGELIFAGERQIAGAVLFLVAAILKHALRDIPRYLTALPDSMKPSEENIITDLLVGHKIVGPMIAITAFLVFLSGMIFTQQGIKTLVSIANHRSRRWPGHNRFFFSDASQEQYITDLEKQDGGAPPLDKQPPDNTTKPV